MSRQHGRHQQRADRGRSAQDAEADRSGLKDIARVDRQQRGGAADTVSVVIRFSLVQLSTPNDMRGRVGAVNFLFINASNYLGQFESGVAAALLGTVASAVLGGVATVAVALLWMKLFPTLRDVERLE